MWSPPAGLASADDLNQHHDVSSTGEAARGCAAEQPKEAAEELLDAAAALEAAVAAETVAALQAAVRAGVAALNCFHCNCC